MTLRERFTAEEWELVRHVPFDAFFAAALADAKVQPEEVRVFTETLTQAATLKDPLHREVAVDIASSGPSGVEHELKFQVEESAGAGKARIDRTKRLLHEKLTRDEYQSFFVSLMLSAIGIAAASTTKKGGLFHKKVEHLSPEEVQMLAAFAATWEIELAELRQMVG